MLPPRLSEIRRHLRNIDRSERTVRQHAILRELLKLDKLLEQMLDEEEVEELLTESTMGKKASRGRGPSVLGPDPGTCPLCGN